MSKIVFFDIDGTLLDHEKKLPVKTKEAITELKKNGVFVAIATGRAPFMYESIRAELGIDSYISFNGQYVVFENEAIYKNPLDDLEIERLLHRSAENNHPLVFMTEKTMKSSVEYHDYIQTSLGTLQFPHPEFDPNFYRNRDIYQGLLFCEEEPEAVYAAQYPKFRFVRWHPFSVDVMPADGSKAQGVTKMIERLGFKLENVYAFGDGLNDIEMLGAAGTGVAMGNAADDVKKHADLVTKDVADAGIWHGLKELELI